MDSGVISTRYARALYKGAVQSGCEAAVYRDMQTLIQAYTDVPALRRTIDNPMLDAVQKESLLTSGCGNDAHELTRRFIKLVLHEGREAVIQLMAMSYVNIYRKEKNIIHGKLITATTINQATEEKVRQMVENLTDSNVEFRSEVDSEIIGGFILEYDTYRMDASVQSQLRSILKQLK